MMVEILETKFDKEYMDYMTYMHTKVIILLIPSSKLYLDKTSHLYLVSDGPHLRCTLP